MNNLKKKLKSFIDKLKRVQSNSDAFKQKLSYELKIKYLQQVSI